MSRTIKIIKGLGGATSLLNTRDEPALIRWETCGPSVARILSEFEDCSYDPDVSSSAARHHEDNEKFIHKFNMDVESVYQEIPCNPLNSM